jgi:hypothetical protein
MSPRFSNLWITIETQTLFRNRRELIRSEGAKQALKHQQ